MKLEHLGTDYDRHNDVYLDKDTGDIYLRKTVIVKTPDGIHIAESKFIRLVEGSQIADPFQGVLSAEN